MRDPYTSALERGGRARRIALGVHAGLVVVTSGLYLSVAWSTAEEPNIGAGLVLIILWPLGLPWGMLGSAVGGAAGDLLLCLSALANVLLAGWAFRPSVSEQDAATSPG